MRFVLVLLLPLLLGTTLPASATPDLRIGEYACVGSSGRIMIGLGFKVLSGHRYTDLDGGSPGTFAIDPEAIVHFSGGHLDGMIGRVAANGATTVGPASCTPTG